MKTLSKITGIKNKLQNSIVVLLFVQIIEEATQANLLIEQSKFMEIDIITPKLNILMH